MSFTYWCKLPGLGNINIASLNIMILIVILVVVVVVVVVVAVVVVVILMIRHLLHNLPDAQCPTRFEPGFAFAHS